MPWKDILRRAPKSRFATEFYVLGMLLVILGFGSVIASINPRPLPISFWMVFLIFGLLFIACGSLILGMMFKVKTYPTPFPVRISEIDHTINSAADLLNDNLYNDIDETSHATYQNTVESLESVKAVTQCMMTKFESSPSSQPILFYKETSV